MSEAAHLSELLLPELELELSKTRRILNALPDVHADFKPHEKSMSLARLAGHLAELPGLTSIILTTPSLDMASPSSPRKSLVMESKEQLLPSSTSTGRRPSLRSRAPRMRRFRRIGL